MAWRALSDMSPSLRRTWQRRYAAGVARAYRDPETSRLMVWTGWPGCAGVKARRG